MLVSALLLLSAHAALPPSLLLAEEVTWSDERGENVVTWSESGGLWVRHFVLSGGRVYLACELSVPRPPCDDDQTFGFEGDMVLSDADGDGIREVSFATVSACVTDVSARDLDIFLWEDGASYALRGQTIWWDTLESGSVSAPVFDHTLLDAPLLQARLESRFAAIIEAERLQVSPEATITR